MKKLIIIAVALFFVASCHSPSGTISSPEGDFQTLLDKSLKYMEYPFHIDSAMMVLHALLPDAQGVHRAKVMNLIGVSHDITGQYDSAATYLYEALRLAEEVRDDSLQISVYNNLGKLQFALHNADESVNYYRAALAIAEKKNQTILVARLLNNIGNTYLTLAGDFEKAIPYFEQCVDVSAQAGYRDGIRTASLNLAEIYSARGDLDKALHTVNRLAAEGLTDRQAEYILGGIAFKKGDYPEAIRIYQHMFRVLITREWEFTILKSIAEAYKASGNLDSTVYYLEKTFALRDTLHNQQTMQSINQLKIEYETEKDKTQIATLEAEKRLMLWLGITVAAVLLLALTALFILWRFSVQKRRLAEQAKQFAEQHIVQLEQEKRLVATQALLEGEVQERSRLARDLHDGLGSILTGAKLNLQEMKKGATLDEAGQERYNATLSLLEESTREMRRVAHHLMPEALSDAGLKQSLSDFCNAIPCATFNYYGDDTSIDAKSEEMLYRVAHELVSNALKHSGATQILVQLVKEADIIALTVQDNGCGFDPSTVAKGMGLNNIRNRVAAYGGNIMVDSEKGVGTEINVELRVEN